jgi:transcriptional regulator with PAS, ATPase and Fis domain/CHASE2 domain-containing sensor protein
MVQKIWRLFIGSHPLQAGAIGLATSLLATILISAAPATLSALDWTPYDTWLRHRAPVAVSPSLTIIAHDQAGDDRFGSGPWDRSVLAELVTAAYEAGALAIGVDHRLDHASSALEGGAASDALLVEAIHTAAPVVFLYDPDSLLGSEAAIYGHAVLSTDPDHVSRRIPLLIRVGTRSVPAFSGALYDVFRQRSDPSAGPFLTDHASSMLVNMVADGSAAALPSLPLSAVWDAIRLHDDAKLGEWMKDKIVVLLPHRTGDGPWLLPTGRTVSGVTAHLHVLNSLLTGHTMRRAGVAGESAAAILLASILAWCLLRFQGWRSMVLAAGVLILYGTMLAVSLTALHVVLPVALPYTASLFVLAGTTAWINLAAGQRMVLLERNLLRIQQEAAAVRDALMLRENRAGTLEEDFETAQAAVAQSSQQRELLARTAESLRSQLADAQDQERKARLQLQDLERQLHEFKAADRASASIGDAELDQLRQDCRSFGIVTRDPALLRMFRDLKKGAKSPLSVLLLGEPGTGKELFARAVHRLSPRAGKTFIAVNMAAISPDLFESELFGHVRGSFTGATTDRRGYFELADHGTVFFDEIGDLRLDHQSKLLRVLQDRSFYRVGATVPTTVDVRVVAATNRDLARGVSEGWFREDLYFRLKGLVFRLPPLRERTGDIQAIAEAALIEIAGRTGRPVPQLSNDALRVLKEYDWPGNVRELQHAIERVLALSEDPVLTKASFSLGDIQPEEEGTQAATTLPDSAGDAAVLRCLRQQGFDMQAAAKALNWDRSTVTQRLKGLCFQALVDARGDQAKAALAIAGESSHVRTVELKIMEYYRHLVAVIEPFKTAEEAVIDCRRRFKNLPDRHFASVESLIRQRFDRRAPAPATPDRKPM